MNPHEKNHDIAIIGLSCRFPQAPNAEAFWQLIAEGQSVFQPMPESRKLRHALENLNNVKGGFLENPYLFDNERFGIPDTEAIYMDPQQRIMLELAVEAMENSGYADWSNQSVGVFVGADQLAYQEMITSRWYRRKAVDHLLGSEAFRRIQPEMRQALEAELEAMRALEPLPPHALVGNLSNMIPGRIAHELNLKGPAFSVDTACSSSLVAVHLACESLIRRECGWALAGGVNLNLTPTVFQYMSAAGVISPSGKCIPFSRDSDGILLGEGAGMVALRRLDDAIRDGDAVWAVIRGSGINNDGRSLGLMAPAWKGQLALFQNTYARTGFDAGKISALEAHGTSTRIGDGVELSVVEKFFPLKPEKPVSIGSVKSNFGHTLAAAGIAGLLKMVLALHHKKLPPTLHETPGPDKKLDEKGIHVQNQLQDWNCGGPRCAGVSSFGFGGTNAHLILEEPETAPAFHPAPNTIHARKSFFYEFFPQLLPQNEAIATLGWQERPLQLPEPVFEPAFWLLLGFEQNGLLRLQEELAQRGKTAYLALCRTEAEPVAFTRTGEYDFCIDTGNASHYRWLMASIPQGAPLGVLFMAGNNKENEPASFIRQTLSGFRFLLQTAKQRGNAKIWAITAGAYRVNADETSHPQQRALAVLAAGALEENPKMRGALIDLGSHSGIADTPAFSSLPGIVAPAPLIIRGNRQFLPVLKPAKTSVTEAPRSSIKAGGAYLVIGGSSGIGALLAEYFILRSARKVIVSGTRGLDALPQRLTALIPDKVAYIQSDVTEKEAMAALIGEVYEKYGEPDGIVYAAGSIGLGPLLNKKQEDFERVLFSKIAGAHYLEACLKNRRPGFVYTISSISGLAPAWSGGMADYAAANAFLDAMAENKQLHPAPWISCSWGLWQNTGMAARLGEMPMGFTAEEGLELFSATLSAGQPHVVALPQGQQALFSSAFSTQKQVGQQERTVQEQPAKGREAQGGSERQLDKNEGGAIAAPSPIAGPPAAPLLEKQAAGLIQMLKSYIAEAVQTAVDDIDENASFYQLGLDSLSAVDVAQKIEVHTGQVLHPTILFEHDTITALAGYLENSRTETIPELPEPGPEPPAAITARFPLIGAQKTFYAQQHFYPEKPCNILVNVELEQPLNPARLQAALNHLIEKHEALRLAFEMTNEGPRQYVLRKINAPVAFKTCEDQAAVMALEDDLLNQVFDLDKPPFFRLAHVSWPEGHAALMLAMHHLIFDAWSMYVLLKELLAVYEQISRGATPDPGQKGAAFSDYIQFHQQALLRRGTGDTKAYWANVLDKAVWGLPLPYRQPAGAASQYRMVMGELGRTATERLMRENQEQRLSVFHTLLAAFFLSLQRQTGRTDMIIRVANANRDVAFPGIESLAGCLADALPLRLKLEAGDGLTAVALKAKQKMLEALRYSGLSSQDIAELPVDRQDDGPVVLSPAGLSFVPTHHLARESPMPVHHIRCRTALPFTDISLICYIDDDNLKCCWNYDEATFDTQDIIRLKDTFLHFLNQPAQSSPLAPPLAMPGVQLFPSYPMLHQKVWAACEQYERRTAIVSEKGNLTYGELARRSKFLADTLSAHLSEQEETVGIFAYPGTAAVIGITGILGAGRAFVSLDPDWPGGRVAGILAHAGIETIVAPAELLPLLGTYAAVQEQIRKVIVTDAADMPVQWPGEVPVIRPGEEAAVSRNLPVPEDARRLAYVMYTSGTSGQPKGVMVTHQAVEVFLNWIAETFRIDEHCRFIHTSSLGFGGSIRQIFSTLLAGATIYPIPRTELKDPQALYSFLEDHQITLLNTVPSVVNNLLEWAASLPADHRGQERLTSLRYLLLGGESLNAETVSRWRQFFSRRNTVVNLYGSTETIVNATAFFIDPETPVGPGSIPIGYQKKGSLVRLINQQGRLCAPGEAGQVYVGGPCLAKGYYREKALTEEKFVQLDLPEARGVFYSTGDLAQADETGLLHFVGRNDDQIQLYGNRIELAEIEDVIYQTHQVKNTAVTDYRQGAHHRLAAFVELLQTGIKPSALQIRDFIAERLPAYMVPHRVILLERMPLNQAGKTDRAALRRMLAEEMETREEAPEQEAPMSPTEAAIAAVWRKLLHVNEIKREDDFFRLGGDSIMALEMLHQLRQHFAVLPKAVTLFKDRKLSALAHSISLLNTATAITPPIAPEAPAPGGRHPLSPSQKGFVLLKKIFPGASPNWAGQLVLEGDFQPEVLRKTLDFLMVWHPMLRTVFITEGAQTWQQITDARQAPVQVFDLSGQSPDEQRLTLDSAFVQLQHTDFALSQYPLFQVHLYRTAGRAGVLLICMHHIITDGWSTHILLNGLMRVYDQILDGGPPDLGTPPPLYADCVPLLSAKASPGTMEAHTAYWSKILAQLPAFMPPPDADITISPSLSFILPAETRLKLQNWCKANGVTLYNLLLTLYARALMQLYDADDLLLNTAVNGRDVPVENIQQVVGCFARNLPLRIALKRESALLPCVKTVEGIFYQALEHQDIPPTELFKIATRTGLATAIFSANRFYFSFMDFSALEKYNGRRLSLLWEESAFAFNAGGAGSEIMMGVNVAEKIRINLNGYATPANKLEFKSLFLKEIEGIEDSSNSIDTALIAYLPGKSWMQSLLPQVNTAGMQAQWAARLFSSGQPKLLERVSTPFGVSGAVFLPFDADELQALPMEQRVEEIRKAMGVAYRHGAKTASLAGILPALTNYGYAVNRTLKAEGADAPPITLTTGHASTVVAVVKTVEKALKAVSADICGLKVAVLGFGSIGQASLSLLLNKLGHPASLIIADLEAQLPHLGQVLRGVKTKYAGELAVLGAQHDHIPDAFYDAGLIIGASSSGGVLNVERLRPGTILVDDSFPPAVGLSSAIARMQTKADVLLLGGGKLTLGGRQTSQLAPEIPENILLPILQSLGNDGMPGCRAEPLLLQKIPGLPPTIGLVEEDNATLYWDECAALGVEAVALHLGGFIVPETLTSSVGEIIKQKKHDRRNE
ncbi:MAG: amino acid adenylation domain-containing protein [Phaeodactylibacter sp.]|nr:amino acid adenylation domain-containing protein [Phaeodactylibacter sp.]